MTSVEKLENVLSKIIIPRFKELVGLNVKHMGLDENWFRIIYYFTPPMDTSDAKKIMDETTSLYKMMGFGDGDIIVTFERSEM